MKKTIMLISMMMIVFIFNGFTLFQNKDKKAILFVNFGTTYNDTRVATIDTLQKKIADTYKDYDVRLAYTSRQIIRKLSERDGIRIDTPEEALKKLKADGYGTVIVQATHIINGEEADYLKREVASLKDDFYVIKLGHPLLTHIKDYELTMKALQLQYSELKADEAVVLIGHGTDHPSTSAYAMIDYFFQDASQNVYFGTVEGFPSYDNVLTRLKKNGIRTVTLMPFLFVAGDHANNDIAGDEEDSWKSMLLKEGFNVNVYLHGLGENEAIQQIFIEHIEHAITNKEIDMKRKKAGYALGK
ncbi:Sirohydrochlorin cobaltochelatase (plasmid) [Sulfurospirillum sp. 'SP']|nr:sirohydrochlorin cobaltochelatase [Sulfurospirillum sp. 'SP']WNZ00331.1 Sirohydrochlorin cobaltochelatase [Sulfurospirillum sp. 'SP']WNZ00384.1 Sirohydrochlorin cobaltochelatase [Sulfurospirillum sp. 'SP']